MKKFAFISFLCVVLLMACSQEEFVDHSGQTQKEITFKLGYEGYDNALSRAVSDVEETRYDRVEYYIMDEEGKLVDNMKSQYDPATAEIFVEGLHAGNYYLLVLGIKGDENKDRAEIRKLTRMTDEWLIFPADLEKPLDAEYFYSQTPFTVTVRQTEEGKQEVVSLVEEVKQKRVVGKVSFEFDYHNPYIRTAMIHRYVTLDNVRFCTTLAGNGALSGESNGSMEILDLDEASEYLFMPTAENSRISGSIDMLSRSYQQHDVQQDYSFLQERVESNRINQVMTHVTHPDDASGLMFLTGRAYREGKHAKILQDDEPKEIYANQNERKFNTANPLQLSVTDDGKLHARFYSPRDLKNVLVQIRIPTVSNEFLDLAYFDTVPSFADFYETLPFSEKACMYRTESGRQIRVPVLKKADLGTVEFKVTSDDVFWEKLQKIKHGWFIYWGLYGGDPEKENGGPTGNWMGIRPVHCRESVAMFLNFTYMIDMPEHEEILRANADRLYDDNKQLVDVNKVLSQMRQQRTLQVGLVYPGNGVVGLGGGSTFGAYQQAWLQHYFNAYSCSIMFHELGHVMGYGHSSSFTYGPWAEELMNNFYVNNLHEFPIDSSTYLNSSQNPNLYK